MGWLPAGGLGGAAHMVLPVIALVGRPNVGKSTLFNRLTRSRDALVADQPGLTRDRQYGVGRLGNRRYVVVDTGGISGDRDGVDVLMAQQVRLAIDEAAARPDVLSIVTADDLEKAGYGDIRCALSLKSSDGSPLFAPPRPLVAKDRVRHVGELLAMVVAESEAAAKAASDIEFHVMGYFPITPSTEVAETLFLPMVTSGTGGIGLGLSIAQSLINQHHGLIECRSRKGETVFTIYLPVET